MSAPALSPFARDVAEGLSRPRKTLPPCWFYDPVGSALFEVITLLPEYGLTRADSALIENARHEIIAAANKPRLVVELGSGSGTKTRHLLSAAAAHGPVEYVPIDISGAALDFCQASLNSLHNITVRPVENTYLDGLDQALGGRRALILFLGSTIGNFTPDESRAFLRAVRERVRPGDTLLLGADLVKDPARLVAAYQDSLGVTAAFNLNLLARINRELDADFDLDNFVHEARYNEPCSRIEMHLRSLTAHSVRIGTTGMDIAFRKGETIWTESSHKFRAESVRALGEDTGWQTVRQWLDNSWGFSETLFAAGK
jgi:L-histidine N-alpha-methyltransferase